MAIIGLNKPSFPETLFVGKSWVKNKELSVVLTPWFICCYKFIIGNLIQFPQTRTLPG